MIGDWWYFSHIGAVCWGIMRGVTGYEATMLRIRNNILLTSLKDRWAAVFEGTQVSHSCWLLIYLSCFAVFLFSITLAIFGQSLLDFYSWVSNCPEPLDWHGGNVQSNFAKWCSHLHGWQVRNSVRAASTLTCMGTSGTSDSTCPDSFFCIASPAPEKRNWVPTENILASVAFPRSIGKKSMNKKKQQKFSHPFPIISIFLWYIREPEDRFSSEVCLDSLDWCEGCLFP